MPKAAVGQTGFGTGEVSPLVYGVTDNPRYKHGLDTCFNYIPTLQGPIIRRPGTKNVNAVKDSANPPILIPFQFSATQNYVLEFGNQYIRFYTNNGQMVTVGNSYKVSGTLSTLGSFYGTRADQNQQTNENTFGFISTFVASGSVLELQSPYSVADVPLIRYAQNGDTIYLVHPNYPPYKLQRQAQTYWKISEVYNIDGPYLPANSYVSVGDNVGTVLSFMTAPDPVPNIITNQFDISGAIADPGGSGQIQITTTAAHGWANGQNVFVHEVTGTTEANNFSLFAGRTSANPTRRWVIQVTSATTFLLLGSVFVHAYTGGGHVNPALFTVNEFKRNIALVKGGIRFWGRIWIIWDDATVQIILGGTSTTMATEPVAPGAAEQWFLGTWSAANGYPACAAFHQDRLWFAGVPGFPQEVDSSMVGLYENFAPSLFSSLVVADNNACSFTLNSDDKNPIRWMASTAQGLLAGTYASEWAMTPSGNSEALTPTNFNAQQSSFFGSANSAAVKIGNAVMYIQRAARKLREMTFFFMAGTFRSTDLTVISEHITLPSITKLAIQKETQPLIWSIRSDGALASLIYNRDDLSLSVGWSRHVLGGKSDAGGTQAQVLDFAIIPDPTVSFDQLWLVVKRWINGAVVCSVEYMTKISDDSIAQADSFQLDNGATYSGAPVTTISGLGYLEGETVGVLTDGGIHPDCVVTAGAIHLNYTASKVQIGYRYKSQGKLLRAEAGAADGTSIGKTRRTTRAAIQMHRVGDISIGTAFNNLIDLNLAQADVNNADTAFPLFSGIIREGLESEYDFESQLCFEQSSPLPGTIQSITTFMEEFDV